MRRRPKRLLILAVLSVALLVAPARLEAAVPARQGRVNDLAGILDSDAQTALQTLLRNASRQTGADIVLATVKSLDGQTIDAYANQLFHAWHVGGPTGNGVLVLLSTTEQRIRIRVGPALAPILPQGLAAQIIRTVFVPSFERGDYRDGLMQGMRRIVAIVRRHHVLTAAERQALARTAGGGAPPAWMLPLFALLIAAGAFATGIGIRTKTVVPVVWGVVFGGTPLVLGPLLFLPSSLAILAPPALIMFVWGYVVGGKPKWRGLLRSSAGDEGATPAGWVVGGTGRARGTPPPPAPRESGSAASKARAKRRR